MRATVGIKSGGGEFDSVVYIAKQALSRRAFLRASRFEDQIQVLCSSRGANSKCSMYRTSQVAFLKFHKTEG